MEDGKSMPKAKLHQGKKIDISLVIFIALGIYICIESYNLGIGNLHAPLAGFFPFLTGVLLGGISASKLLTSLWSAKWGDRLEIKIAWGRVLPLLGGLLGYVLLMDVVGFFLATFLFVFLVLQRLESKPWWVATFAAVGISSSMHLAFRVLLRIQLPKGFIGF
jgi:putative tricarboxylic transport membrane protein